MQRLSGADATFLYGETRNARMEIATCLVVDGTALPRGEALLARARAFLEPRLHLAPPLRRRLVRVPLSLDHPVWIEDPDFDLEYHLRHAALPAPGTLDQFGDLVGRLLSRPLDHTRPLWELYVIEGLDGDRGAVFIKSHHAAVDGVAAFQLVGAMMDLEADAPPPPAPPTPWEPEAEPSELRLLAGATANLARQPLRGLRAVRRLASTTVRAQRDHGDAIAALGRSGAPHTRFNGPIGPHRRVRFLDLPLPAVRAVKDATGTKLNDVVLAIVAGGLRRYLQRHDELPDVPLVAFVPVSVRSGGDDGANSTSMVHVDLPTDEPSAEARLRRVAATAAGAKARHEDLGPSVLVDISELGGPPLAAGAFRVMDVLRLNERVRFGGNVVVSNIPGPPIPLFTIGSRVERIYPMGPLAQGAGLNVTLLSYEDRLGFALVADRDLVPDLDDLVRDLATAFDDLRVAIARGD